MKKFELFAASAIALVSATPVFAQSAAPVPQDTANVYEDIVITAQRQSERLQDVPIAVSAFTAEALDKQQIVNPTALQLTLPNITYTKTNYTTSSFTIRGIGDLCTGVTCDGATAIHVNDMPLLSSRLFESEFYDLERVEVLRGPQGTLFGRNATSGVVNFITAKPDLSGIHAQGEAEYGNFDSKKVKGMVNLPLTEALGIRLAGLYINRDGYTRNLFNNSRIDGRDLYSVRGTLSWEPTPDTRIDLIGYYFREKDDRSRIQKQLCHRDPTGILGCLPDRLASETTNGNATLSSILTSREFFSVALGALGPTFAPLALGSIYGADVYSGVTNPADVRTVNVDFAPRYFAEEEQYTAKLFHDFGPVGLNITGGYMRNVVNSQSDFNLAVERSLANNPGLVALNAIANSASPFAGPLAAVRNVLIPNGPAGGVCQSAADPNGVGVYGGVSAGCYPTSLDFDQSSQTVKQYSAEAHIDSHLDGMFNFLLGGIYFDSKTYDNSYYVQAFGLDYAAGILGAANTIGTRLAGATTYPNTFRASPDYRNNTDFFHLKSYGLFGETYFDFTDQLKLTLGARYNHDDKLVKARTTFIQDANGTAVVLPYGSTSITQALGYANLDYDANVPGNQEYAVGRVKFSRLTGRAVLNYKITPNNLLYASYSRGYKSGGINPPLSAVFAVPTTFTPEKVDSFELGSKNSFGGGQFQLNLTGFYYKYKGLQLSRIVARTSVNDNVDANIYGVEAEAILRPTPDFAVNMNASYLHSEVSSDKFLGNPRDPSGGRSDAVIIKDITNASNCAVVANTPGNVAGVNAFVGAINGAIGLAAPVPITNTTGTTTGAFGVCSAYASNIAAPSAALRAAFGTPTGPLPFTMLGSGVAVNIRGNQLPNAPKYKFSVGAQYTIDFDGLSLVPRADLSYTGGTYGSIFGQNIDRIQGYEVINAQIQLNGRQDRWFVRGFIQNLTDNNAITGEGTGDQSSGLFTNIFTLEPRRYGIAAGFKF